jgi:hypothetical protein
MSFRINSAHKLASPHPQVKQAKSSSSMAASLFDPEEDYLLSTPSSNANRTKKSPPQTPKVGGHAIRTVKGARPDYY